MLLVGAGDPYLETALSYLPNTELYGVTPDKYGRPTPPELFDLIIFEGFLPADAARAGDPRDRADGVERPRRGHRDADRPGDRHAADRTSRS